MQGTTKPRDRQCRLHNCCYHQGKGAWWVEGGTTLHAERSQIQIPCSQQHQYAVPCHPGTVTLHRMLLAEANEGSTNSRKEPELEARQSSTKSAACTKATAAKQSNRATSTSANNAQHVAATKHVSFQTAAARTRTIGPQNQTNTTPITETASILFTAGCPH